MSGSIRRLHARALEAFVLVPLALEIAQRKEPGIAALGIGQYLPTIQIAIPEVEAVGAVLQNRLADLGELPLILLLHDDAIAFVDLFLGLDVEPVVSQEIHRLLGLALDRGEGVVAAEPDHERDRAGLDHVEPEKLLVEFAREIEIERLQRPMRQEIELQSRLRLSCGGGGRAGCIWHDRFPSLDRRGRLAARPALTGFYRSRTAADNLGLSARFAPSAAAAAGSPRPPAAARSG